jgi:hypothetical protein
MKCLAIRARAAAASLTFVGLLAPAALAQQPQHSALGCKTPELHTIDDRRYVARCPQPE